VLRQLVLLWVLAMVAIGSYMTRARSTSWAEPLWVTIYPINGDGSATAADYIGRLDAATFKPMERFMAREARRYGVAQARPIRVSLGRPVGETPPPPPQSGNPFRVALWSLRLRWWAGSVTKEARTPARHQTVRGVPRPGTPPGARSFPGTAKGDAGCRQRVCGRPGGRQQQLRHYP